MPIDNNLDKEEQRTTEEQGTGSLAQAAKAVLKCTLAVRAAESWLNGEPLQREAAGVDYRDYRFLFPVRVLPKSRLADNLREFQAQQLKAYAPDEVLNRMQERDYYERDLDELNALVQYQIAEIKSYAAEWSQEAARGMFGHSLLTMAEENVWELEVSLKELVNKLCIQAHWQPCGVSLRQAWGYNQVLTFLETMCQYLAEEGYRTPEPEESLGNMQARAESWRLMGPVSVMLTRMPVRLYRTHCEEAAAIIRRTLSWHEEMVNRLLMRKLIPWVESCIEHVQRQMEAIRAWQAEVTQERERLLSRLSQAGASAGTLYQHEALLCHVAHIEKLPMPEWNRVLMALGEGLREIASGSLIPFGTDAWTRYRSYLENPENPASFWQQSQQVYEDAISRYPVTLPPVIG